MYYRAFHWFLLRPQMEKTTTDRKSTQRCGIKDTTKVPNEATEFLKNHFSSILASGVQVVFPSG